MKRFPSFLIPWLLLVGAVFASVPRCQAQTIQSAGPSSAITIQSAGPSSSVIVGGLTPTNTLSVSLTPNVTVIGSSSSTTTSGDALLNVVSSASTTTTQNLNIGYPLFSPMGVPSLSITNNVPGVATIDNSTGITTYVSTGTASFTVTCTYGGTTAFTRQITFSTSANPSTSAQTFNSFISSSLGYAMVNTFSTLLTNAGSPNANGTTNIYSSYDYSTNAYTRNTSHWLAAGGFDLTCIPAGNSHWNSAKECGVLVTPQHLVQANHVALPVGTTMVFVGPNNAVQTATIAATTAPTPVSGTGDTCVAILSAPLVTTGTGAITPCALLPGSGATGGSYATHLPNPEYRYPLACVEWEQHADSNIYVYDLTAYPSVSGTTCLSQGQSTDPTRSLWWQAFISGDSGGGMFMLNPSTSSLMMVSQLWTGSDFSPMDAAYISAIQTAANTLTTNLNSATGSSFPTYTLTQANLGSYTP